MEETPQQKIQSKEYFTNYARKRRMTKHRCKVCGEQAYTKILISQEYRCAKHQVAPLKEELIKQQGEKKNE